MPDTTPLPLPECPREDCPATIDHWHDGEGAVYPCTRQLGRACLGHESGRSNIASRCYAPRTQPAPARPPVTAILDAILTAADDAKRAHDQMCDLAETLLPAPQPAPGEDERIAAWEAIAAHPIFAPCYATAAPLLLSMLDRLDGLDAQPAPQPPAVVLPTVDELARRIEAAFYSYSENYKDFKLTPDLNSMAASRAALDLIAARVPVWKPVAPGTVIKSGTRYRCETVDGESSEGTYSLDLTTREDGWFIDPRTVPAEPDADLVETIAQAILRHDTEGEGVVEWERCSGQGTYRGEARAVLDAIRAEWTIEPKAADQ